MNTSNRNDFFKAILPGLLTDPEMAYSSSADIIRHAWYLADLAAYFEGKPEFPHETARRWIKGNYLILDTETTGLGRDARIVEIAIINCAGETLLNTLINPGIHIPQEATAIHGITDEMVKDAPSWRETERQVITLLGNRWVAYNAKFDAGMIEQEMCVPVTGMREPECAMQLYVEYNGEWDAYRRKYKWSKLVDAATALDAVPEDGNAHRALYDCRMTLNIIRRIAEMTA
ncbi:phage protein [Trabulsiella guamensis ATCC 49490]|uniref:Phage protein n=1 Tax=Trabulsiella guamensis ATCC 49490 TaxID=1005994 RepID=A0A084ZUE3_9ENTR|nr:3'-5' exonuclease [Trabulsiella guamensis]KFC01088.1 phage protein [Trabulsiella guamensis ATCC 49490]